MTKKFKIRLLCRNCRSWSDFRFPAKTRVIKPGMSGTTRVIYPDSKHEQLICPVCEIGEVY